MEKNTIMGVFLRTQVSSPNPSPAPGPFSFNTMVQHNSSLVISPNLVVQEAPTITIPMVDDALEETNHFSIHALVCCFNGFWS